MSNESCLNVKTKPFLFLRKKHEKLNPFDLFVSINYSELVLGEAKEVGERVKFSSTSKVKVILIEIISTKMKQCWRRSDCLVCHEPMPSCAEFVLEDGCSSLTLNVIGTMGILLQTQN